jgi:hypothetical protein
MDLDLEQVMGFAVSAVGAPLLGSKSSDIVCALDGIDLLDPTWQPSFSDGGGGSSNYGSDSTLTDDMMLPSPITEGLPPLSPAFQTFKAQLQSPTTDSLVPFSLHKISGSAPTPMDVVTATAATPCAMSWADPYAGVDIGPGVMQQDPWAPLVPDVEGSVDELILVSHALWPTLKELVEEVRAELLGHPTDDGTQSALVSQPRREQPVGQADDAGKFLADGIAIYRSLLESLQSCRQKTSADWANAKGALQCKVNACLKDQDIEDSTTASGNTQPRDTSKRIFRQKPYRKKRAVLPKRATQQLKSWLFANVASPYPNDDEKDELILQTGLSVQQINNWFINARRRLLVSRASPGSTTTSDSA